MTFFSRAARIWIQGFRTVAGETANAIVNPCLRRLCSTGPVHLRNLANSSLVAQNFALRQCVADRLPSSRLAAPEKHVGAWMKSVPWDAGKLSLTVPIVAHLGDAVMGLSHNFLSAGMSCTIAGETRRRVLLESLHKVATNVLKVGFRSPLRHRSRDLLEKFRRACYCGAVPASKPAILNGPSRRPFHEQPTYLLLEGAIEDSPGQS
jgi:hypothetical protein